VLSNKAEETTTTQPSSADEQVTAVFEILLHAASCWWYWRPMSLRFTMPERRTRCRRWSLCRWTVICSQEMSWCKASCEWINAFPTDEFFVLKQRPGLVPQARVALTRTVTHNIYCYFQKPWKNWWTRNVRHVFSH